MWWVLVGFLLPVSEAFAACTAQSVTNTTSGVTNSALSRLPNPIRAANFQDLANEVLGIVSKVGAVVAVFFIIYAGFLFVTAGGNETKQGEARKALLYAVIGTAILIGAQALSTIICSTIESLK